MNVNLLLQLIKNDLLKGLHNSIMSKYINIILHWLNGLSIIQYIEIPYF
jgi:hypothetical protein